MTRHDFDGVSFSFGVLFLLIGLLVLSGGADALPMEWAGPFVAVLVGLVILFAARPRRAPEDTATPADE